MFNYAVKLRVTGLLINQVSINTPFYSINTPFYSIKSEKIDFKSCP